MNELVIHAVHQDGMRVLAGDGTHQILMDYPLLPNQSVAGLTPLQTLLASLCACSASTVKRLLERMKQPVIGLEVNARAVRRQEHPTLLTEIALEFVVAGDAADPETVARAIKIAEEQICPVWNMLKGGTPIKASFRIVPALEVVGQPV